MRIDVAIMVILVSTAALADEPKAPAPAPAKPATCTPPDEMVIHLPLAKAITLNNILQDVDVTHREWRDVATDVRAQLVGQCKETKH